MKDLAVQDIKNEFSVEVYEANARISLAAGDLEQYNQCQSKLYDRYKAGVRGNKAVSLYPAYNTDLTKRT